MWVRPAGRTHAELGIEARWTGDGTAALIYPSGGEVKLLKDQGLALIEWAHDWPNRTASGWEPPEGDERSKHRQGGCGGHELCGMLHQLHWGSADG